MLVVELVAAALLLFQLVVELAKQMPMLLLVWTAVGAGVGAVGLLVDVVATSEVVVEVASVEVVVLVVVLAVLRVACQAHSWHQWAGGPWHLLGAGLVHCCCC